MMAFSIIYFSTSLKKKIKNLAIFGVVSFLPLLAMHLFTMGWHASLGDFQYVDGTPMHYFQQLFDHADTVGKSYRFKAAKMVFYRLVLKNGSIGLLMIFGTAAYVLWSLINLKRQIKERQGFDLMVFSTIFVALNLLFFLWTNPKERHTLQSLPFICLLSVQMLQSVFQRKIISWLVVGIYVISTIVLVSGYASYDRKYQKVDNFFKENALDKNIIILSRAQTAYAVRDFNLFKLKSPLLTDNRGESLYTVIESDEILPPIFKEIGIEKVGEIKSDIDYTQMAKNLYKIDPIFRFILFISKKLNSGLWEKLMFLHYNDNFRIYRFEKWPSVVPEKNGYRMGRKWQSSSNFRLIPPKPLSDRF